MFERISLDVLTSSGHVGAFDRALHDAGSAPLRRGTVSTVQINVGRICNQACLHCHVEAGPQRTEIMSPRVADRVLELLRASQQVETVDITGGAPELCPEFRRLVVESRRLGLRVIDRSNLTILFEAGQENLATFLAEQQVHIVASLPCYSESGVEAQRGHGVFEPSIRALQLLNGLGYGIAGSDLTLDLVYNPGGAFLPPAQAELEQRYKSELKQNFGISFSSLLTLANMPIKRFAHSLERDHQMADYMTLLERSFNPATIPGLMCSSQISIGYEGSFYDCDFNQMLELNIRPRSIFDVSSYDELAGAGVITASHCYGCTAGSGSSCGGALLD